MSRVLWLALLFGVLILSFVVVRISQQYTRLIPMDVVGTFEQTEEKWHDFSPPNGAFSVRLPILPQRAQDQVSGRSYDMYVAETPDQTIFMISLITFAEPPSSDDDVLKELLYDTLGTDGELLDVKVGTFRSFRSIDFSIEGQGRRLDTKAFMKGKTMYVLTKIAQSGEAVNEDFAYFVNSFQVGQ